MVQPVDLATKFSAFSEHWHPYIISELNENYIKLAKVKGELVWHAHDNEDELFIVLKGTLIMDFRDGTVEVRPGQILTVPKGVEHRPRTLNNEEVQLMLVEPKETLHTGTNIVEQTVKHQTWL